MKKNNIVFWEVFYISDLYDTGNKTHNSTKHKTREKARNQMREMKAQPWTFSSVFMCRVVNNNDGAISWERAR